MSILLLGADGQVGYELHRAFAPLGAIEACTISGALPDGSPCTRIDFTDIGSLAQLIAQRRPALVLNAVAHTQVDRAEDEPDLTARINAQAVDEIAQACAAHDAKLIHYSTDYVFGGDGNRPWREDDATAPLGVYGRTKLAGEEAVRASGCRHLILRTAWVYGARGQNFLRTMLRVGREREELRVVADQIGSPTPARWIAAATALAHARKPEASGTWHLVADGQCSWHEFAGAIFDRARAAKLIERAPRVLPIASADYPTKATRPGYSRLDTSRFAADFDLRLPEWREGLAQVIGELAEAARA
ncbi:MAG: dTDP-4-dehydrorhamnose reductase [Proteobacteria bacterium]|nr:dTDP-4-dehydrorhamnose reductase [Pseudomonadota bacterium]